MNILSTRLFCRGVLITLFLQHTKKYEMFSARRLQVIFVLILGLFPGLQGCGVVSNQKAGSIDCEPVRFLDAQQEAYAHFCSGYFFMLDQDWENAASNFEKALLLDRSSERAIRHLAACYFQTGKNEKALQLIKKLAKIKPDEFNVHYSLATLYETVGKAKEAIEEYELARQCKTTELDNVFLADTLYRLANLYMQAGMMDRGVACYKSMFDMKLVSDPAKIYYEIGQRYFEKNDVNKALEYFLKVQEANPGLNFIHFYLALCYDALSDYDNAENEANAFLKKDPDNWVLHYALADIYGKRGRTQEKDAELKKVQEILRKSVEAGSKNPKEYFLLCQQYREQNKIAEAIAVIESMKLIPLDKVTNRDIHYMLANLYYECRLYDKVEEELQMAVNLDPNFHEANNFLGYFYAENNKNLDLAIQLINKALKAQPQNGAYLDSLGWAYYKKWQLEGRVDYLVVALQKLQKAIKLMEEPDIYEHIGDVQYSLGGWAEAIIAWEKAQALYQQMRGKETQIKTVVRKLETVKKLISDENPIVKITVNHNGVENGVLP